MLYFVIPLKCKNVSSNWEHTSRLLEQTLNSVCAQTDKRFQVIIVGHDLPDVSLDKSHVRFIHSKAPVLDTSVSLLSANERINVYHTDKGLKLLEGLEVSKQEGSTYTMLMDADDLISNRICDYVLKTDHPHGYYINYGYRMDEGRNNTLYKRANFFHECGTCNIVKTDLAPFPEKIDYSLTLDDYFVRRYVVHAYVEDNMRKLNYPMLPIPFYAAIYRFHSDSIYSHTLRRPDTIIRAYLRYLLKGVKVTPKLRSEYTIPQE